MAEQLKAPIGQTAALPPLSLRHDVQYAPSEAPESLGSFLFDGIAERYYPEGGDTRPRAPADEETGLPLAIAPDLDMESLNPEDKNVHHAVYPHRHPRLQTLAGKAFRVARLQVVPAWFHNGDAPTAFHTICGDGIAIPSTENELAGGVGVLVAGFVPEQVIDTTSGTYEVRAASSEERQFLTRTLEPSYISSASVERFRHDAMPEASVEAALARLQFLNKTGADQKYRSLYYGGGEVTQFLRRFVVQQDPSMLNRRLMRRFLRSGEPEYGMTLLGHAAAVAAETATIKGRQFREVYGSLRRRGLINANMPPYAADFLFTRLGSEVGRLGLMGAFYEELEKARQLAG